MISIPQIRIEVCSMCQNRCEYCAHQGMRYDDPTYQMSLEEIKIFITHFQKINCKIGNVDIHGAAEPLLWRHFNEAIRLIADSKIADSDIVNGVNIRSGGWDAPEKRGIQVTTNGKLLHIIADDVWNKLTLLYISIYGYPIDKAILEKHPGKYECLVRTTFDHIKPEALPFNSFSRCACAGPMYYKGMIYPYCGPPLFDACILAKIDHKKYCIPIEEYDPTKPVDMPYQTHLPCAWCWSNYSIPRYQTICKQLKN